MKRLFAPALAVAASVLLLAGCGGTAATTATTSAAAAADKTYEIGISQIVTHPSLDAVVTGFKKAFEDAGVKANFDVKIAAGDSGTNTAIANTFAAAKKDLVVGVSTPSALALAQAITDKPVLFSAITDPVGVAKIAKSWEAPGGNVTGASDINPFKDQLQVIKDVKPDAKTVGIVYTSGEPNAVFQMEQMKALAPSLGLSVQAVAITTAAEIQQAANSLNVDAFYVGTDNTVVSGLEALIGVAEAKKVPLIASDDASVKRGAVAAFGANYEKLGYQTGQMAIKILTQGADPGTMPIEKPSEYYLTVNESEAKKIGLTIPANWANAKTKY